MIGLKNMTGGIFLSEKGGVQRGKICESSPEKQRLKNLF